MLLIVLQTRKRGKMIPKVKVKTFHLKGVEQKEFDKEINGWASANGAIIGSISPIVHLGSLLFSSHKRLKRPDPLPDRRIKEDTRALSMRRSSFDVLLIFYSSVLQKTAIEKLLINKPTPHMEV